MRLFAISVAGLLGVLMLLGLVLCVVGARLPRTHQVSRSVVVAASPSDVYRGVTDFANAATWRKDLKRIEVLGRVNGRRRFKEYNEHGAVTYEIAAEEPGRLLVTQIVDRDLGYSGSWTYLFTAEKAGTRVTITERGDVSNVIFRFMSRYVFGYTKTMDAYLESLARHFGDAHSDSGGAG